MRRLLRSLFWGVLLPVCYTFIAGPLSTHIGNRFVGLLLYLPIGWPRYIYYLLFPHPELMRFGDFSFFIYMVVSNVALYTCLTYMILWALSLRRRSATPELSSPPPSPPDFGGGGPPPGEQPTSTARR